VGAAATACVLGYGMYSMAIGNANLSQKLMRARVLVQAGTLIALMFTIKRADFGKKPASSPSNFPPPPQQ